MKVVVDTNVLVSAVLSPHGTPARVLDFILRGQITLLLSPAILQEYAEVLGRKEFGFDKTAWQDFLRALARNGQKTAGPVSKTSLPDPDDEIFLSCAKAGKADFLITGNKKHFPDPLCRPIPVVSPREFLDMLLDR